MKAEEVGVAVARRPDGDTVRDARHGEVARRFMLNREYSNIAAVQRKKLKVQITELKQKDEVINQ